MATEKDESGKLGKILRQLLSVQLFGKITTTTLNFMVARIVLKEVYGFANIQLQLY